MQIQTGLKGSGYRLQVLGEEWLGQSVMRQKRENFRADRGVTRLTGKKLLLLIVRQGECGYEQPLNFESSGRLPHVYSVAAFRAATVDAIPQRCYP